MKGIVIQNVQGSLISGYGCSVTGIAGMELEDVELNNIRLEFTGGQDGLHLNQISTEKITIYEMQELINRDVPDLETSYPRGEMFGRLPAYGFFIRHARNVSINRMQLSFNEQDIRPALICDNVQNLEVIDLRDEASAITSELIRLINVRTAIIARNRPTSPVPVFLSAYGDKSDNIILQSNLLQNAKQKIAFKNEAMKNIITESGTVE